MYRILIRETRTRAFYFALKEIAAEQHRCEQVLGMLLPPTLVASWRSVAVKAATDNAITVDGRADHALGVPGVVSAGEERFAEAFESASVLFAEGAGWDSRAKLPCCLFSPL